MGTLILPAIASAESIARSLFIDGDWMNEVTNAANQPTPPRTNAQVDHGISYGRLDIAISQGIYKAGELSTVSIVIRNPFDKEVDITEIEGPRSSYLSDTYKSIENISRPYYGLLRSIMSFRISEISVAGIRAEFPVDDRSLNIVADQKSEVVVDTDTSQYSSVNVRAKEEAKVTFKPQPILDSGPRGKIISLKPHCEAVAYFNVRTAGWLFFIPTKQSLSSQIRYRIDGTERTQVVTSEFEIKPPLRAIVIGGVLGAILGTFAKFFTTLHELQWQSMLVSVGASVVMSLIASIALSRKSSAQAFITVEDFYGGFVIGALIGYGGTKYFEQTLIPKPS